MKRKDRTKLDLFLPIPYWLAEKKELSASDKVVYGVIYRYYRMYPVCRPSISSISNESGMSSRTVTRALDNLVKYQLIQRENIVNKNGKGANQYFLTEHPWGIDKMSIGGIDKLSNPICQIDPSLIKNRNNIIDKTTDTSCLNDFKDFWKNYPRKNGKSPTGKATSSKLFVKLNDSDRKNAIRGLDEYRKTDAVKNGYIKHPERYIKHRIWEDYDLDSRVESVPGSKFDIYRTSDEG